MTEQSFTPNNDEITDNDKMMALLSYVIAVVVPIIILYSETGKTRAFQRYHAINSLVVSGVTLLFGLLIVCPIAVGLSFITAGLGSCCTAPFALVPYALGIYYGIKAYQGEYVDIPFVTTFAKGRGWI